MLSCALQCFVSFRFAVCIHVMKCVTYETQSINLYLDKIKCRQWRYSIWRSMLDVGVSVSVCICVCVRGEASFIKMMDYYTSIVELS